MKHIRPHKILGIVADDERITHIYVHQTRGPMLLELVLQISLLKYVKPAKYFEFGTYLGINALNMAMNMHEWEEVITLDLDELAFQQVELVDQDIMLAEEHLRNISKLAFIGTPYEKQITGLYGDSNVYDLSKYYGKIEMVYVDGGRDLKTLHSDTENALKMLPEQEQSCIVWHDYQNPKYNHLTQYLDGLSTRLDLYHIVETMLVFHLKNAHKEVVAKLI
jgi:hypothetical protein